MDFIRVLPQDTIQVFSHSILCTIRGLHEKDQQNSSARKHTDQTCKCTNYSEGSLLLFPPVEKQLPEEISKIRDYH